MRHASRTSLILTAALVVASCDLIGPGNDICFSVERDAIDLYLSDADTGERIIANDLRVVVRDGAFADTVNIDDGEPVGPLGLVPQRPGTYEVSVTVEGYAAWHKDGIRVPRDGECDIEAATIYARLRAEVSP